MRHIEQHVLAHLSANLKAKLCDLYTRGVPIDSDDAFFHFGGGLVIRNLCREQLTDNELAAYSFLADWDSCYIGVLAAIAEDLARGY